MSNLLARILYLILIRPWLRHIIGVQFENRKALEKKRQYIIVANHNSHFDSVAIMAALPNHKFKSTRAVAGDEYFGKSALSRWLMSFFFHAVLIKRQPDENDPSAIDILDAELKKGKSLIIYPEGTRGTDGVVKDFKSGVAVLLKKNPEIPFVPVYLDGFGKVLPKNAYLIIPLVCKVRFGDPVYAKQQSVEEILEFVQDEVLKLQSPGARNNNHFELE